MFPKLEFWVIMRIILGWNVQSRYFFQVDFIWLNLSFRAYKTYGNHKTNGCKHSGKMMMYEIGVRFVHRGPGGLWGCSQRSDQNNLYTVLYSYLWRVAYSTRQKNHQKMTNDCLEFLNMSSNFFSFFNFISVLIYIMILPCVLFCNHSIVL